MAKSYGQPNISRVYGNQNSLLNWDNRSGFSFIYSGSGKNAADLHLAIDAMEFSLRQRFDLALICTSDSDFIHLTRRLRESGKTVIGFGEHKTADNLRETYNKFHLAKTPIVNHCASIAKSVVQNDPAVKKSSASEFDHKIREIISANSKKGAGIRLTELNTAMKKDSNTQISQFPEKSWRGYLANRKTLFELDPKGADAKMRFIPNGL